MFDDTSTMKHLSGESFTDKLEQIRKTRVAWGSTNFQSLINLICEYRKGHPNIPLEDFPTTLLVISDMQFNPCGSSSNYEAMMDKLRLYFPDEWVDKFKCIWWFCAGRNTNDVPATMDQKGMYLISGFDGSIISLILGGEQKVDKVTGEKRDLTMEEAVIEALNQEVLQLVI